MPSPISAGTQYDTPHGARAGQIHPTRSSAMATVDGRTERCDERAGLGAGSLAAPSAGGTTDAPVSRGELAVLLGRAFGL
jgi:hypothetical protein